MADVALRALKDVDGTDGTGLEVEAHTAQTLADVLEAGNVADANDALGMVSESERMSSSTFWS